MLSGSHRDKICVIFSRSCYRWLSFGTVPVVTHDVILNPFKITFFIHMKFSLRLIIFNILIDFDCTNIQLLFLSFVWYFQYLKQILIVQIYNFVSFLCSPQSARFLAKHTVYKSIRFKCSILDIPTDLFYICYNETSLTLAKPRVTPNIAQLKATF